MNKLTMITLDCGDVALYLDGHYLGSEDYSSERLSLADIVEGFRRIPDVCIQTQPLATPEQEDWSWNEIAEKVFAPGMNAGLTRSVTVEALMARLSQYPADALCCGTFWMADDFRSLDETLTDEEIEQAMLIADDRHDCNHGYNWFHLQSAINEVRE
jgi:hypothetical protein